MQMPVCRTQQNTTCAWHQRGKSPVCRRLVDLHKRNWHSSCQSNNSEEKTAKVGRMRDGCLGNHLAAVDNYWQRSRDISVQTYLVSITLMPKCEPTNITVNHCCVGVWNFVDLIIIIKIKWINRQIYEYICTCKTKRSNTFICKYKQCQLLRFVCSWPLLVANIIIYGVFTSTLPL